MSEETRDGFLPLQPAELTLAREMLGLDNIGFDNIWIDNIWIDNIAIGKFYWASHYCNWQYQ